MKAAAATTTARGYVEVDIAGGGGWTRPRKEREGTALLTLEAIIPEVPDWN
jgi:hypothetical protein